VLIHRFERALPFDLWRADDHHMHHAAVRCNYSPYSALWDKVFGTHREFAVKNYSEPARRKEITISAAAIRYESGREAGIHL
jgi:sterol desaturase/sphingolipid hydroxylase (fatty acid hydroxylase superfamily)